jgi:hypothetical protein
MGSQAIEVALPLLSRPNTAENSRATRRAATRSAAAVGASVLWLFIGAADGRCGESKVRIQPLTASTEAGNGLPEQRAIEGELLLAAPRAETAPVNRQQLRGGIDDRAGRQLHAQLSGAEQGTAVQTTEPGPSWERQQALARELERDRAETLARALTSSLRAELDALQSAAEATRIKQRQALERERERAEALARELATLQSELAAARTMGKDAAQAIDLSIRQTEALEQERDKSNELARELNLVRGELEAARVAISKAMQTAEAEVRLQAELAEARIDAWQARNAGPSVTEQAQALDRERARADSLAHDLSSLRSDAAKAAAKAEQRQTLENELREQRDRATALSRQRALLRVKLNKARRVAREATRNVAAVKLEQKQILKKERDNAETLARELASTRRRANELSARLAAAYAEVPQVPETSRASTSEQKMALAADRARDGGIARELASVSDQNDAGQLAALKASWPLTVVDGLPEWITTSRFVMTEGPLFPPRQPSVRAPALNLEPSTASEAKLSAVQSTAHERVPEPDSNHSTFSAQSTPASASPLAISDEQRLLTRAVALLRQANITGARPLLEHAAQRGSARAAFMLAETYDERVLQSWPVRGISGDITKARELYKLAQSGGIEDAKERIKRLQQQLVRRSPTQRR